MTEQPSTNPLPLLSDHAVSYFSCSDRAFTSSLSCRTISVVLRISASLRATPMVDAIDKEPGVQLAVARVAFARKLHELRAPVLRIVDEFDEPLGRKLIRQPLHALAAGGPHLGDLRHGQRTKQREASHEAERTAAPAGDEPCLLADGPYPEEALGHFEHQLRDRLGLAVNDWARPVLRATSVLCRADAIASVPFGCTSFSS